MELFLKNVKVFDIRFHFAILLVSVPLTWYYDLKKLDNQNDIPTKLCHKFGFPMEIDTTLCPQISKVPSL